MDRSVKATLLSGLLFPGAGQWFLGRRVRALVFLVPALGAAWYFGSAVMEPLMGISREILAGTLPFDPFVIQARVDQTRIDTTAMNVAALVMVVSWVGATVDAWLLGRATTAVAGR
jgi:hypothetical protein